MILYEYKTSYSSHTGEPCHVVCDQAHYFCDITGEPIDDTSTIALQLNDGLSDPDFGQVSPEEQFDLIDVDVREAMRDLTDQFLIHPRYQTLFWKALSQGKLGTIEDNIDRWMRRCQAEMLLYFVDQKMGPGNEFDLFQLPGFQWGPNQSGELEGHTWEAWQGEVWPEICDDRHFYCEFEYRGFEIEFGYCVEQVKNRRKELWEYL